MHHVQNCDADQFTFSFYRFLKFGCFLSCAYDGKTATYSYRERAGVQYLHFTVRHLFLTIQLCNPLIVFVIRSNEAYSMNETSLMDQVATLVGFINNCTFKVYLMQ